MKKHSGKVSVRFSPELFPYLLQLKKQLIQYDFSQTLNLRSTYAIALYELLKIHAAEEKITVGLEDLRKYLAVGTDKYQEFTDFRRRVIDPAIKEINNSTSLTVKWNGYRQGKTYTAVTFQISVKSPFGEANYI
ncbi:MAG: replication initiation protein [Butyrivibrio sp.]|nr:replication initiation protein [Butyrivibrio sp.]